jgi:hypothetical protein
VPVSKDKLLSDERLRAVHSFLLQEDGYLEMLMLHKELWLSVIRVLIAYICLYNSNATGILKLVYIHSDDLHDSANCVAIFKEIKYEGWKKNKILNILKIYKNILKKNKIKLQKNRNQSKDIKWQSESFHGVMVVIFYLDRFWYTHASPWRLWVWEYGCWCYYTNIRHIYVCDFM